jgi:hypothetical protein
MKPNYCTLLTKVGFVALLCGPSQVLAQNIALGSAANFAVLGGSAVTNTGTTTITGDVGVWPGTSITGLTPVMVIGTIHTTDAVAQQAQTDLTAAYTDAATRPCAPLPPPGGNNLTGLDLGTITGPTKLFPLGLPPGVYCFNTSAQLTGNLTLNGPGVYIFQIGSTLTTASGASITLTNGASPCGVWWQVGSSATLGTTTSFVGNILAFSSIGLTTGATTNGRILARNAAVTLQGVTVVTACSGGPPPPVPSPIPPTPTVKSSPTPTLPSAAVPTISGWAMIAFGGLLAMVAFAVIRRLI